MTLPPDYATLDEFEVDFPARQIVRDGVTVRLSPQAAAVLLALLRQANRVVTREELLRRVWPGTTPSSDTLTHLVRELRRALGDVPGKPVRLETIPRVGYRLNAQVRLRDGPAPLPVVSVPAEAPAAAPPAPRHLPTVLGLTLAVALAVGAWVLKPEPRESTLRAGTPIALTSDPGSEHFPALSPDGGFVAYVAEGGGSDQPVIMLKGRDAAARAVALTPPRGPRVMLHLSWSPDGTRLLFAELDADGCHVRTVAASGGGLRDISPCEPFALDAQDWAADGRRVFGSVAAPGHDTARELASFDAASGEITRLAYAPRAPGDVDLYPRASPDGQWIAFRRGARPFSDLWLVPARGGDARRLAPLGARVRGLAWMPDSTGLVVSSDHAGTQALHHVGLDGRVVPLGIERAHFPSVARRAAVVAFEQQVEVTQLVRFDLDAAGAAATAGMPVAPSSRSDSHASLSASGRKLAFVSERSGRLQVWMHDFDTAATAMLTDDADTRPQFPQWSTDETSLLYVARGDGAMQLRRLSLAERSVEVLSSKDERVNFGRPTPDGAWIDYSSNRSGRWEAWRMRADGSDARQLSRGGATHPRSFGGDPHVYFSKPHQPGLFRLHPDGGEEMRVSPEPAHYTEGAYTVARGELITFAATRVADTSEVRVQRLPADAALPERPRVVATLHRKGASPNPALATFDASGRRVVATLLTTEGSDIFVAEVARIESRPPEEHTQAGTATGSAAQPDR